MSRSNHSECTRDWRRNIFVYYHFFFYFQLYFVSNFGRWVYVSRVPQYDWWCFVLQPVWRLVCNSTCVRFNVASVCGWSQYKWLVLFVLIFCAFLSDSELVKVNFIVFKRIRVSYSLFHSIVMLEIIIWLNVILIGQGRAHVLSGSSTHKYRMVRLKVHTWENIIYHNWKA